MSSVSGKSSKNASLGLSYACLGFYLNSFLVGLFLPISVHAQTDEVVKSVTQTISQSELDKQLDRENLRKSIDAQFEQLTTDHERETAFSLELADNYFEYANLLSDAGYFQDANSAYEKALHIQKTNHGIDSEQQLPALEALFNNYYLAGQIDQAQSYLTDVVRIERQSSSIKDKYSTVMQLKMGHHYLEKLKNSSPTSEIAPRYLNLANKYFLAVIDQNKEKKLSGSLFPYGELAMTNYLGNQLERKAEKVYSNDFVATPANLLAELRGRSKVITSSELAPIEDIQYNEKLNQALPNAISMLKYYFNKADTEGNIEEALRATLALGDLNYLSDRTLLAKDYYAVAGAVAKLLPENHPDRLALNQPAQLPDFKYAYNVVVNQNEFSAAGENQMLAMPLQFDVTKRGAIKNIKALVETESKLISMAKRELRKHPFRPAIIEGALSDVQEFVYVVAVNVN